MFPMLRDSFRTWMQRFGEAWNRFWFTPSEPLMLAVLRASAGVMALYLHLTFTFDLMHFFSADGLVPPWVVEQWAREATPFTSGFPALPSLSYLSYVTNPTALWILHGLGFVVLLAFTLGVFTRYASIAALIVVLSYMHRAPMLVSHVEPLLAALMFYLCLGPCGACFSLDSWWRRRAMRPNADERPPLTTHHSPVTTHLSPWATVSQRLIQVHLAAFCFMMAISKLGGGNSNVWWTGEAVWMLISRPDSRLVDMTWLARFPFLVDAWSHTIVWFELVFPVLIWNRWARPLMLALGAAIWGSLILVTGLATFYLLLILATLAFVPATSLRALLEAFAKKWQSSAATALPEALPQSDAQSSSPREQTAQKSTKLPRERAKSS